jgi:hypothetical protein
MVIDYNFSSRSASKIRAGERRLKLHRHRDTIAA